MAKDYIEDKSGAKFPLNYTFDGVNNFVFDADVMFEDLQALCLVLVAELERHLTPLAPDKGQAAVVKKDESGSAPCG